MSNIGFGESGEKQTLDQMGSNTNSTLRPYNVLVSRNLGNMTITMALPMYQFFAMSAVANDAGLAERDIEGESEIAQRKLDPNHAKKLALYLLRALVENTRADLLGSGKALPSALARIQEHLSRQPYFATQPIVANLRNAKPGGKGLPVEAIAPGFARVFLSDADILWVIDGQHRRHAMDFLFEFLKQVISNRKYPKRGSLYSVDGALDVSAEELLVWNDVFKTARQSCNVIVDVHLGLTAEQERQVFHDLNNLAKPVAAGLAYQFDSSNPINLFIKEQLIEARILPCRVSESDVVNWHEDDGSIAYKDLVAICARMFLNKTSIANATNVEVSARAAVARKFWQAVAEIPGWGKPGAKMTTVSAQPVFLKGFAKLVYDHAFGRDESPIDLHLILEKVPQLDLTHTNPCWRYYQLSEMERATLVPGLSDFLPPDGDGSNRDIGGWDEQAKLMRFGAKHNDIFPILGDMLRWQLKLPPRTHKVSRANNDE
jgi:hypothetical protein